MLEKEQGYMRSVEILQIRITDQVRNARFTFKVRPLFYILQTVHEGQPVMVNPDIMVYIEVFEEGEVREGFHVCPANIVSKCNNYPLHFAKEHSTSRVGVSQ